MLCFGLESTAHSFGAAVVDSRKRVLSNEKKAFTSKGPGIVPREVAEWHRQNAGAVVAAALEKSGASFKEINLISFSQGPGIGNCLQVGLETVKKLAGENGLPVVGVNHMLAHLEIGLMATPARDPVFLFVSGPNTQVIAFEAGRYRVFGETLDIGAGNLLDKFARHLGLGFPGGPKVYELSLKSKRFVSLPYSVKGMDACFSGLLTRAKHLADSGVSKADLAYSLQETAFSMLVEVSERAMAHCDKKELLLGGGVAASEVLQEKARVMCRERKARFFVPPREFLTDNAAMIAWQGILQEKEAVSAEQARKLETRPCWRVEDVEVGWR